MKAQLLWRRLCRKVCCFHEWKNFRKRQKKIDEINEKLNSSLFSGNLESVKSLIEELDIKCPVSGTNNWTDVRQFNLMFKTQIGATVDTFLIYI